MNKWGDLKSINITKFYQMRFARIAPCLLALLLLLSILDLGHVPIFELKNSYFFSCSTIVVLAQKCYFLQLYYTPCIPI